MRSFYPLETSKVHIPHGWFVRATSKTFQHGLLYLSSKYASQDPHLAQIAKSYEDATKTGAQSYIANKTEFYNTQAKVKIGEGYKDLHKITVAFFKDAKFGLIATILYVIAMAVLAFHLLHGFSSAFQSLGLNNPNWTPKIKFFGAAFAIVVPLLFAIIPVYIHFFLK